MKSHFFSFYVKINLVKVKSQLKRIAIFSFFLFLIASPCSKNLICFEQKKDSSSLKKDISTIEQNLFWLVNKEREKLGLSPLSFSLPLSFLARRHSQDMALREYISHLSSSGKVYTERLVEDSFYFRKNGENVAFSSGPVAELIHKGFMESPGHRANILDPDFDEVGIGVIFKEGNGYYTTQDFIRSLELKEEEEVKKEIQKKINSLRGENSLPPLLFLKEADKYAYKYSLQKAEDRPPPASPSHFRQSYIIYITSPSLEKLQSIYEDKILDKIYETAGLGISFGRNKKYPGGSYFITLILFPENKYKSWSNKDLKDTVFRAINKIREKKRFAPLIWDEKLMDYAEETLKIIVAQRNNSSITLPRLQGVTVLSYFTEDPNLLPKGLKEKIENNFITSTGTGIGILFEKNPKFPRGIFWVAIFLWE